MDYALVLLNQIVIQLRQDAGIQTREPNRTVKNLEELLIFCIGKNT